MNLHVMANSSHPITATAHQDGWMNEGADIVTIFRIAKLFRMQMWISWRAGREGIKEAVTPPITHHQGGLGHTW